MLSMWAPELRADVAFLSNRHGGQDGYVYRGGSASTADTNGTLARVGEPANTDPTGLWNAFFGINLAQIPAGSTITAATLFVYNSGMGSGAVGDIGSALQADHVDFGPNLTTNCWKNSVLIHSNFGSYGSLSTAGWKAIPATAQIGYAWTISKGWSLDGSGRWAQFRFRPAAALHDDATADYANIRTSEYGTPGFIPYCVVYYTPPSGGPGHLQTAKNDVSGSLLPGATNQVVLSFSVTDASNSHSLVRCSVSNGAVPALVSADLASVRLWVDQNRDNAWDAGDLFIAGLNWSTGRSLWTNAGFSSAETNHFIVTINLGLTAPAGYGFRARLPVAGIRDSFGSTNSVPLENTATRIVMLCPSANHIIISEVYYRPSAAGTTNFVELYNPLDFDVSLDNWRLLHINGNDGNPVFSLTLAGVIPAYGHYLVDVRGGTLLGRFGIEADLDGGMSSGLEIGYDGLQLLDERGDIMDIVGWKGSSGSQLGNFFEGAWVSPQCSVGESIERKSAAVHLAGQGNAYDTQNNLNDFQIISPPQPQNSMSPVSIPPCADLSSPAGITNLRATNTSAEGELKLVWTAPGDNSWSGQVRRYHIRWSATPFSNETTFMAAVYYNTASWLDLVPAGQIETRILSGLPVGSPLYVGVRAVDSAGNYGPLVYLSQTSPSDSVGRATPFSDTLPPAIITNLSVTNAGPGALRLTWTAPGDDGWTGSAASYIVKVSTAPILTESDFSNAPAWPQAWVPKPGGQEELRDLSGLIGGQLYYIAVKAVDNKGLQSAVGLRMTDTARPGETVRPYILSCRATNIDGQPGIGRGDRVVIRWSESMNAAVLSAINVDGVLVLSAGTWLSGAGTVSNISWSSASVPNDTLTVILSTNNGDPTLVAGAVVRVENGYLTDMIGNIAVCTASLSGTFGDDNQPPGFLSATAYDTSGAGAGIQSGDTVVIRFTETMTRYQGITRLNIDSILRLNAGGGSWGTVIAATNWTSSLWENDTLTVVLTNGSTAAVGAYIQCPSAGTIEDRLGNDISAVSSCTLRGSFGGDTRSPQMISAIADDSSAGGSGIQTGDRIVLLFDEAMNSFTITSNNIDTVLVLDSGTRTWKNNSGGIGAVHWTSTIRSNDTLVVTLSAASGVPANIAALGSVITIATGTIKDRAGNNASGGIVSGTFGSTLFPGSGTGSASVVPATVQTGSTNLIRVQFRGDGQHILRTNSVLIRSNWLWLSPSVASVTLSGAGYASARVKSIASVGGHWLVTITNARVTDLDTGTIGFKGLRAPVMPQTIPIPCSTGVSNSALAAIPVSPQVIVAAASDWYETYFNYSPYSDALDSVLVSKINAAKATIRMTMYNCGEPDIIAALRNAANRGVDIDIVCERANAANFSGLNGYGSTPIQVRDDGTDGYPLMHNKFIVFDYGYSGASTVKNMVWTGSYNITSAGTTSDSQDVVAIKGSYELAADCVEEFSEMWSGVCSTAKADTATHSYTVGSAPSPNVEIYFSPTDTCNSVIRNKLATADDSVYFCIFTFTDDPITSDLITKWNSGVKVAGVFDESQSDVMSSAYPDLVNAGVPVKKDWDVTGLLHHKYMLIDYNRPDSDPMLIVGSHNWTASANGQNDENLMVVHDAAIVAKFYNEFLARYGGNPFGVSAGVSITPASVIRNTGGNTVTLRVTHGPDSTDPFTTVTVLVPAAWNSPVNGLNTSAMRGDGFDYAANSRISFLPMPSGTLVRIDNAGLAPSGPASYVDISFRNLSAPADAGKSWFEVSLGTAAESPSAVSPLPFITVKPCEILLNEVAFNSGGGGFSKDWVELYCRNDGNNGNGIALDGFYLSLLDPSGSSIKTFTSSTLHNGEYAVVHFEDSTADETSAGGDHVLHAYTPSLGPVASDEQMVLCAPGGAFMDAVGWANGGGWTAGEDADIQELADAGEWILDSGAPASESDSVNSALVASGVSICRNGMSDDANHKTDWSFDQTPTPGEPNTATTGEASYLDVVVNEIMFDPATSENGCEWFEIHNTRDYPIDLSTWDVAVANNSGSTDHFSPAVQIPAGGFLVFVDKLTNKPSFENDFGNTNNHWGDDPVYETGGWLLHGSTNGISLNNSSPGSTVLIRDGAGKLIDAVSYDPAWGGTPSGATNLSLERRSAAGTSADPLNWDSCQSRWTPYRPHRGSPGSKNSVSGGNDRMIVISEVLFDDADLPDRDEWVELYNRSPVATVNLNGWVLTDYDGSDFSFPNVNLPPLCRLLVHSGAGSQDADFSDSIGSVFTGESLRDFLDSQDELGLYTGPVRNGLSIVDFVAWSSTGLITDPAADDDATAAGLWQTNQAVVAALGSWSLGRAIFLTNEDVASNGRSDYGQLTAEMAFVYSEGYPNLNDRSNRQPNIASFSCWRTTSDLSGETVLVGEYISLRAIGIDRDPIHRNVTTAGVTSDLSDKINGIVVTLLETLPNSGVYTGSCRVSAPSDDVRGNIKALPGETVTIAWHRSETNRFDTVLVAGTSEQDIKINEFRPNISSVSDNFGRFEEEFIELYNAGRVGHNITGWTLTMRGQGPAGTIRSFGIPQYAGADIVLSPGAFLVCHFKNSGTLASNRPVGTSWHIYATTDANWLAIDSDKRTFDQFGGAIGLYTPMHVLVDYVAYSQDQAGSSIYSNSLSAGLWSTGDFIRTGRYDGASRYLKDDSYLPKTVYARRSDGTDANDSSDWHWIAEGWGCYKPTPGSANFPFADQSALTPPDDITITSVADRPDDAGGAVVLQWNASPDSDIRGYAIFYSTAPFVDCRDAQVYFASPWNNGGSVRSWTVRGLWDNTSYYFSVVAMDKNNNFDLLSPSTTVPVTAVRDIVSDIVFSEVMFDPQGADANYEFIELYNNGVNPVDLKGWYYVYYAPSELGYSYLFSDDTPGTSGYGGAWGTDTILRPGAYACAMDSDTEVPCTGGACQQDSLPLAAEISGGKTNLYLKISRSTNLVWAPDLSGFSGLNNVASSGDIRIIELFDASGRMIDSVKWWNNGPGYGDGYSMERTDPDLGSFDLAAWQTSTNHDGTPLCGGSSNRPPLCAIRLVNGAVPALKWYHDTLRVTTWATDADQSSGSTGRVTQCEWEYSLNYDGLSGDWLPMEPNTNFGADRSNPNTANANLYSLYWSSVPSAGTADSVWIRSRVKDYLDRYGDWDYERLMIDNEPPSITGFSNDPVNVYWTDGMRIFCSADDGAGSGLVGTPEADWFIVTSAGQTNFADSVFEPMIPLSGGVWMFEVPDPGWSKYGRASVHARIRARDLIGNIATSTDIREYVELGPDHLAAFYDDGIAPPWGEEPVRVQVEDIDGVPVPGSFLITLSVDANAVIQTSSLTGLAGLGTKTVSGWTAVDGTASFTIYDPSVEYVIVRPNSLSLPGSIAAMDRDRCCGIYFQPGRLRSFDIVHDGLGYTDAPEPVAVNAIDEYYNIKTDYTGSITLWLSGDTPGSESVWSLLSSWATLSDSGAGKDWALVTFSASNRGTVRLALTDDTVDTVDIDCRDSSATNIRDDETTTNQGPLVFISTRPPSRIYSVAFFRDPGYSFGSTNIRGGDVLYIQLIGKDSSPYTADNTVVFVRSSVTDPVGLSVLLTESDFNSGTFQGTVSVRDLTDMANRRLAAVRPGEVISVESAVSNTIRDQAVLLATPPTSLVGLNFFTSDYMTDLPKASLFQTGYLEVRADAGSPYTRDITSVRINDASGIGFVLPLEENGVATGLYRSSIVFDVVTVSNLAVCRIACDPAGDRIRAVSMIQSAFTDIVTVSNAPVPPKSVSNVSFMKYYSSIRTNLFLGSMALVGGSKVWVMVQAGRTNDGNAYYRDHVEVLLSSSSSDPAGIPLSCFETGLHTGIYTNSFFLSSASSLPNRKLSANLTGETIQVEVPGYLPSRSDSFVLANTPLGLLDDFDDGTDPDMADGLTMGYGAGVRTYTNGADRTELVTNGGFIRFSFPNSPAGTVFRTSGWDSGSYTALKFWERNAADLDVMLKDLNGSSNIQTAVSSGATWTSNTIALSSFAGVDLSRLESVTILRGSGSGTVLLDDVALSRPAGPVLSVTAFSNGFLRGQTNAKVGDIVGLQLNASVMNSNTIDSAWVVARSSSDLTNGVRIRLVETARDSGIYRGLLQLDLSTIPVLGRLAVKPGDFVLITSADDHGKSDQLLVQSGPLHHFVVLHDGSASIGAFEQFVIRAEDDWGMRALGFTGSVTLSAFAASGSVQWSNISAGGGLVNLTGIRSNQAVFTFISGNAGIATLAVRDNSAESLDPECRAVSGEQDDDREPRWLRFSGAGQSSFVMHCGVTNVSLGSLDSAPRPGATIAIRLVVSNLSLMQGLAVIAVQPIPANTTFRTQTTPAGWTVEYSTNATPSQSWGSSDYSGTYSGRIAVKWIRWRKSVFPPNGVEVLGYRVIVR
jgi:phosphatidylserine/phosphatidylglycerophosphate/cardiolipin synthase-like enzyme